VHRYSVFSHWRKDQLSPLLYGDGFDLNGRDSWETLVNKCLVDLDQNNCITMHDHQGTWEGIWLILTHSLVYGVKSTYSTCRNKPG
ncbi:hypothetical protein KI387_010341, partial [Taxus chinensis]